MEIDKFFGVKIASSLTENTTLRDLVAVLGNTGSNS
jgi:hypothetical protein